MKTITAPYGFVPLAEQIVYPDWVQPLRKGDGKDAEWIAPPLQDVPFEDGIDGVLDLHITAETPIFTRGTEGDGSEFFSLPDGRRALPGTLLKGAIRNVIEIATFGRMAGRVNDHRYSVRDLQNRNLYGRFMADIVRDVKTGKTEPMPLVNAGWLERVPAREGQDGERRESYRIRVCDYAKIEYGLLEDLAHDRGARKFRPGEKQSAVKKYEAWGNASLQVEVTVRPRRPKVVNNRQMPSEYGVVEAVGRGRRGILVFTGQPSRYFPDRAGERRRGSAKHHDFVFLDRKDSTLLEVADRVFEDFKFAHSNRGQQNNLGRSETPNEEWAYWEKRLEAGERVPVFFLATDDGRGVRSFGLAMMFRLPYRYSILEAVGHAQRPRSGSERVFDFADGLFGTVRDDEVADGRKRKNKDVLALKGRVDFSHAVAVHVPGPTDPLVDVVLGAPKASYYPNYVEQIPGIPGSNPPPPKDGKGQPLYKTWQDSDCRPRGWKRYRPLTATWKPQPPSAADGRTLDLSRVSSRFRPLPAGTRFAGRIYLHNVRPVELGALLWALDFGGHKEARHTLGMGRPLGYGRSVLRVGPAARLKDAKDNPVDLDSCRAAFQQYMASQVQGWAESPQILELLALAKPVPPEQAKYQRLDPGARVNEFVDAKKDGLALPSAHRPPGAGRELPQSGRQGSARPEDGRFPPDGPAHHRDRDRGGIRTDGSVGGRTTSARRAWPGKRRGDVLKVKLIGQTKKGKWRAAVLGFEAQGVIEGEAPPDVAVGGDYEVEVIAGGDPNNLNLKWRGNP